MLRLKFFSMLKKNLLSLKSKPDSNYNVCARRWYNSAVKYLAKNKFEEALYALNNAIELIPDYPEAWYNKGYVLEELKSPDKAITAYEKAIELDGSYVDAWFARGVALFELNELDKALESFEKVVELNPRDYDALTLKGYALIRVNRIDEAFDLLSKVIEINPEFGDAWYNLACIYSIKNNREKTLESLSMAFKVDKALKKLAMEDKHFKKFSQDEMFKKITK